MMNRQNKVRSRIMSVNEKGKNKQLEMLSNEEIMFSLSCEEANSEISDEFN